MNEEKRDEFLAQEYLALQKAVETFDERMISIKAWSVTASGAALVTAYLQGQSIILLIGAVGAGVFWFIDAFWKVNQRVHYPRIRQIEAHFAGAAETKPFQVSQARKEVNIARPKVKRALLLMFEPIAALPHAAIVLAGLALYFVAPPAQTASKVTDEVRAELQKRPQPKASAATPHPPSAAPR